MAKHAEATDVTVTLAAEDGYVRLTVADNGRGLAIADSANSEQPHGWGVLLMRERAEAIGGRLEIQSEPGKGTTIAVEVDQ